MICYGCGVAIVDPNPVPRFSLRNVFGGRPGNPTEVLCTERTVLGHLDDATFEAGAWPNGQRPGSDWPTGNAYMSPRYIGPWTWPQWSCRELHDHLVADLGDGAEVVDVAEDFATVSLLTHLGFVLPNGQPLHHVRLNFTMPLHGEAHTRPASTRWAHFDRQGALQVVERGRYRGDLAPPVHRSPEFQRAANHNAERAVAQDLADRGSHVQGTQPTRRWTR